MNVKNIHRRVLAASRAEAGALLDALATESDPLWPIDSWPRLRLDRPLGVGAVGGHGPIRYTVSAYEPGRSVTFRFTAPRGFDGTHRLNVEDARGAVSLQHVIEMEIRGLALVSWPLVFGPLQDALLEDALDKAERAVGGTPEPARWSFWVRALRSLVRRRARSYQGRSNGSTCRLP